MCTYFCEMVDQTTEVFKETALEILNFHSKKQRKPSPQKSERPDPEKGKSEDRYHSINSRLVYF